MKGTGMVLRVCMLSSICVDLTYPSPTEAESWLDPSATRIRFDSWAWTLNTVWVTSCSYKDNYSVPHCVYILYCFVVLTQTAYGTGILMSLTFLGCS